MHEMLDLDLAAHFNRVPFDVLPNVFANLVTLDLINVSLLNKEMFLQTQRALAMRHLALCKNQPVFAASIHKRCHTVLDHRHDNNFDVFWVDDGHVCRDHFSQVRDDDITHEVHLSEMSLAQLLQIRDFMLAAVNYVFLSDADNELVSLHYIHLSAFEFHKQQMTNTERDRWTELVSNDANDACTVAACKRQWPSTIKVFDQLIKVMQQCA